MDDTNTHPTLGYYTTPTGAASATLACPNNAGVVTQGYSLTSQMFKPSDKCYAIDPWTFMRSQGRAGTYRNCKAGPFCGYLINPIAIINCPLDGMASTFLIISSMFGFLLIKRDWILPN
ncbi:MAG: hypothetical protein EOO95_02430 [Pedobacter sp.]|nr:MAG: hypothetical protein EOO95_02430 [Pedobacter sp.]